MHVLKSGLAIGLVLALGSGAAVAQPQIKDYVITGEIRDTLWCSVVFYEETFWHDPDSPEANRYDELSLDLDEVAFDAMADAGLDADQSWEIWDEYAQFAYMLYESDNAVFEGDLSACEAEHAPQSAPTTPPAPPKP